MYSDKDIEKAIQDLCIGVLSLPIENTSTNSSGGCCPYCGKECSYSLESVYHIEEHEPNCPVLIAKEFLNN